MKNNILFLFGIVLIGLFGCSKEEQTRISNPGDKLVMSSEYNPDFYPEGDAQELMTNFFNEAIELQDDTSFICTDYGLSEGGWYLTAGLNYLCADATAQLDSLEEYTFNGTIEITGDTILELDGNSLMQCMLSTRNSINELSTGGKEVGAVQCIFNGISGDDALFSFKAIYGNTTNYDDVTLTESPVGVYQYATLKMGVPNGSYQSAATETRRRYNPYLYKSKIESEVFANKKYLVTNMNSNNPILWTDWQNCYLNIPNNDYILYRECAYAHYPQYNQYLLTELMGTTFNYYLNRFFQLKLTPIINQNLNYTEKTLYLGIEVNWLPSCIGCSYFNENAKSVFAYTLTKANITLISDPLPTL